MDAVGVFAAGVRQGAYKDKSWITSMFCITGAPLDATKPYAISRDPTGVYYTDPSTGGKTKIDKAKTNEPLLTANDTMEVDSDLCVNVTGKIKTTVGICLANKILLCYPFGKKIPYINGDISIGAIEQAVMLRRGDLVDASSPRDDNLIYVDEYLLLGKAVAYIESFGLLFIPTITERSVTPAKGIGDYKKKLLAENKDRLNDPVTATEIFNKLEAYDAAYLKDDPSETFNKGRKIRMSRNRLHVAFGQETSMGKLTDPIYTTLSEGWDLTKFATMNNTLRSGSYARGKETQLGGVLFKYIMRATANAKVVNTDCGQTVGITRVYSKSNVGVLLGAKIIVKGVTKTVQVSDLDSLIGVPVTRRTPLTCKLPGVEFCSNCLSENLTRSPYALSAATSKPGSDSLNIFMAKMHGKKSTLAVLNADTAFH